MFLSIFELFKVGIGPSSSHTVGPMVAARRFLRALQQLETYDQLEYIQISLHGSLAFTGKGHATDKALMLGILGEQPDKIDPNQVEAKIASLQQSKRVELSDYLNQPARLAPRHIHFDPEKDIIFDYEHHMPRHTNGMRFFAYGDQGQRLYVEDYYSVGGGFVQTDAEMQEQDNFSPAHPLLNKVPFDFASAAQMLEMGKQSGLSIAQMKTENETTRIDEKALNAGIDRIIDVMAQSIERGLNKQGILPGGLNVKRRAYHINQEIEKRKHANLVYPHDVMDHISLYALAVNEENAAGGQIVTAPTNGAAGIIPAVLTYYRRFCPQDLEWDRPKSREFLLTAAAIGGLIKHNASISGAEVGCQGEVGSASSMAAAGLAAALGGTNYQIENAAEIALEHHLGMTCDPIGGLVQIPCIERNAMGAIKAVNAASLALKGDGTHFVSLDSAILTMKETGRDMLSKYKETSQGGLAVNGVAC
ncbi:MAG: L-serine ammonia-lyase [Alphaproteobacteria bacterium]